MSLLSDRDIYYIACPCSEIDDEIKSLSDFSPEVLVPACVQCLRIINPEFNAPSTLPEAMAARLRVCTALANALQVRNV